MRAKRFSNTLWMVSEKVVSLFGLLFVTSFVAEYIGPLRFGQIALAIAIFQIVQVFAQLGFDNILFKRISVNSTSGLKLIASTFKIRTLIYTLLSCIVLTYFYYHGDLLSFIFMISVCISFYFTSIDVYVIYNDAVLASKKNTYANVIGLVIGLLIRYLIAKLQLAPWFLSFPIILTTLLPFCIRYSMAPRIKSCTKRNRLKYSKYIFVTGMPLVISTVSMALYSRINQFTVSYLVGNYELGIYSVALTLGTTWGFIGNALAISFLSRIYAEKKIEIAEQRAAGLILGVIIILLIFPILFILFGNYVIHLLYGNDYVQSYKLGIVICFSTVISTVGFISNRYIVKFSGYNYLSKKTVFTLALSIPLSILMIHFFGLIGAAYSLIIIELTSLTIMNYFFKNFLVLKMHLNIVKIKNLKHLFD